MTSTAPAAAIKEVEEGPGNGCLQRCLSSGKHISGSDESAGVRESAGG